MRELAWLQSQLESCDIIKLQYVYSGSLVVDIFYMF